MISSNTQKSLLLIFLASLLCLSCKYWQDDTDKTNKRNPDSEIQVNIPFLTKEPKTFQTEVIISNFINGDKTETKYFIAKDGVKSLQTFNVGSENERSILRMKDNKTFLINHSSKNFRESFSGRTGNFENDITIEGLTSKWLNERKSVGFEKLEDKNGSTGYRIKFDDSKSSEVLIFIDEKLQIPIKQEFYDLVNDDKSLTFSVELKNFNTQVERSLFELPDTYEEIE